MSDCRCRNFVKILLKHKPSTVLWRRITNLLADSYLPAASGADRWLKTGRISAFSPVGRPAPPGESFRRLVRRLGGFGSWQFVFRSHSRSSVSERAGSKGELLFGDGGFVPFGRVGSGFVWVDASYSYDEICFVRIVGVCVWQNIWLCMTMQKV